jgi:hypothetical protein
VDPGEHSPIRHVPETERVCACPTNLCPVYESSPGSRPACGAARDISSNRALGKAEHREENSQANGMSHHSQPRAFSHR